MMELQFHADAKEYELMALLYIQHFAETNRQPDLEMTKNNLITMEKKQPNILYW